MSLSLHYGCILLLLGVTDDLNEKNLNMQKMKPNENNCTNKR